MGNIQCIMREIGIQMSSVKIEENNCNKNFCNEDNKNIKDGWGNPIDKKNTDTYTWLPIV